MLGIPGQIPTIYTVDVKNSRTTYLVYLIRTSLFRRITNMCNWFNSYGHISAGWVDLAMWLSCIEEDLQPTGLPL